MGVPTPHIGAKKGDFAKTVIMPGDPLRAKYIADNYLTDCKCVNEIRNVLGFTGKYKGKDVSVMASGMGMPSIGIYSYELFNFYDVENIMRVGSAGALSKNLKLKDIVVALGACTDSNYSKNYNLAGNFTPVCSYDLLKAADKSAEKLNMKINIGNVLSSDVFYVDDLDSLLKWQKMGVLGVEMEAAALYMNAARLGKKALCICSVSDSFFFEEKLSAHERQTAFNDMMVLALETALEV